MEWGLGTDEVSIAATRFAGGPTLELPDKTLLLGSAVARLDVAARHYIWMPGLPAYSDPAWAMRTVRPLLLADGKTVMMAGGAGWVDYSGGSYRVDSMNEVVLVDLEHGTSRAAALMHSYRVPALRPFLLPDGDALVVDGIDSKDKDVPRVERYHPATNTWTITPTPDGFLGAGGPPSPSTAAYVQLADGDIIMTGSTYDDCGRAFRYHWKDDVWEELPPMPERFAPGLGVMLPSGKILFTVGRECGPQELSKKAVLFDPLTREWTKTGSLVRARNYAGLTLLPCGSAVVVGGTTGYEDFDASINSVEVYDPSTGRFQLAPVAEPFDLVGALEARTVGDAVVTWGRIDKYDPYDTCLVLRPKNP